MVAVVYPLRLDDTNETLRYSLRSLFHLGTVDEVWTVGDKPPWLTGVRHIPGNLRNGKPGNVFGNIRLAADHPDMPADFVAMNDDFFICRPWTLRLQYRGTLADHIDSLTPGGRRAWWGRSLASAERWCRQQGIETPLSYDLHCPMPVDRDLMAEALGKADVDHRILPQWRSVYGNHGHLPAVQVPDCKVRRTNPGDYRTWPVISTSTDTDAFGYIKGLFPEPSRWEADA